MQTRWLYALRLMLLGPAAFLLIGGRPPPASDFLPWVSVRTELSDGSISISAQATLLRARIYLGRHVIVDTPIQHESRGRSDLDIFYSRHLVGPGASLFALGRANDPSVVACTVQNTFVSANIFVADGRIDGRTCLVDSDGDGVFEEVRWSPSVFASHNVHSFRLVAEDPPILVNAPYRVVQNQPDSLSPSEFIDVEITYAPSARGGVLHGTVTGADGVVVESKTRRISNIRAFPRAFDFFGFEMEFQSADASSVGWRVVRGLPSDRDFRLAYDYRD